MDTKTSSSSLPPASSTSTRPKRRKGDDAGGRRYFLLKTGSSPASPELGQEAASEGEALIQAFRSGQSFYTLTAWKAVTEVNDGGSPMIVKQAGAPQQVQS